MNVTAVTIIVTIIAVVTVYFERETYTSFRKCLDEKSATPEVELQRQLIDKASISFNRRYCKHAIWKAISYQPNWHSHNVQAM
jgi:hypothetical protein